jgi:hypothetical protein
MRKTSVALTLPRRYPRSRCSMERTAAMEAKDKFFFFLDKYDAYGY